MKLGTTSAPVLVAGGGDTSSFSIAMNGKAFRVLSDTLYQNKIGSIVREISCNAYDAHVAADKSDVPFEIHLPNAFEPWFSVQDFGVGLSPSDIVNVFTVYFQSTKDNSNDAIGAFGLGAKTPFSYTDQFTVTSVYDGVCSTYSAYITESGVPAIVKMAETPTTDTSGVEIKMSVKRDDYRTFANEVAGQLQFFPVKPIMRNVSNFQFAELNASVIFASENVNIGTTTHYYSNSGIHVVQGVVGYPLDISQLENRVAEANYELLRVLYGMEVYLHFNIGEIGVTASRESIEYNATTAANIDAKLTVVATELRAFLENKIAEYDSVWDKALFLNSVLSLRTLAKGLKLELPNLITRRNGAYAFDFSKMLISETEKNQYGNPLTVMAVKSGTKRTGTVNPILDVDNKSTILLRDTTNRPFMRVKHFVDTHGSSHNTLVISSLKNVEAFDDAYVNKLRDALGGFPRIIRLSEIELPVRDKSERGSASNGYSRPTYYVYHTNALDIWNIRSWTSGTFKLKTIATPTAYVAIDKMRIAGNEDLGAVRAYKAMVALDDNTLPLIAIRNQDVDKAAKNSNLIRLPEYIAQAKAAYANDGKLRVRCRHAMLRNQIRAPNFISESFNEVLQKTAPNSKIARFVQLHLRARSNCESDLRLIKIAQFMGWDSTVNIDAKIQRHQNCLDKLLERYPLVGLMDDWRIRNTISMEHIAKYVSVM